MPNFLKSIQSRASQVHIKVEGPQVTAVFKTYPPSPPFKRSTDSLGSFLICQPFEWWRRYLEKNFSQPSFLALRLYASSGTVMADSLPRVATFTIDRLLFGTRRKMFKWPTPDKIPSRSQWPSFKRTWSPLERKDVTIVIVLF